MSKTAKESEEESKKIIKYILYTGTKNVEFSPGAKVSFHFKTTKCDVDKTVIDDSRKMGRPMQLVLGKVFKLTVWEFVVQKMSLNEIATFRVHKSLLDAYPYISKTLREVDMPRSEKRNRHCCGLTLMNEGVGYDDLNSLIKKPEDLEFTIELLQVVPPTEYNKESWQMTEAEKLDSIPILREKGNKFFKEKDYKSASETYANAIGILEQLKLAEKPNDEEWLALNAMKLPILLNFAQCKFLEKEYYAAIEHCTTVLKFEPDNVKALYRRGMAHIRAWDEAEANRDLKRAVELDPSLKTVVEKELQDFAQKIKKTESNEKKLLSQMFS